LRIKLLNIHTMDYLTSITILLTVWPAYGLIFYLLRGVFIRVDATRGLLEDMFGFCDKNRRRPIEDSLDRFIVRVSDLAYRYR
jgi:hypothetical protein